MEDGMRKRLKEGEDGVWFLRDWGDGEWKEEGKGDDGKEMCLG